jgi:hypothetical protein
LSPTAYILYVANARGQVIGEMAGMLEAVSWTTDGYGMATLVLPLSAALTYGPLLEFGNRVVIEFSNGLPPWGGVIDVPRETTLGQLRVQMYEAAYTFNWRLTQRNALYLESDARPAAAVLVDLVRWAGLDVAIYEAAGQGDGAAVEVEFHYETLSAAADKLRGLDGAFHYFLRPRPSGGRRIDFELVTFRDMLTDDSDRAIFIQGHNLVDWAVLEQGPIYNEVLVGVGDFLGESEAGETDAYAELYTATDAASVRRYGLRQHMAALPDVAGESGPGRAGAHARAQLAATSKPRLRVRGASLNLPPGLYRDFGIGSRVRIDASTPMATSEYLTVIGMEFQPSTGTLSLTFDDGGSIEG